MIANPKSKIQNQISLRPPQFRLRTLLLLVTACGALFALAQWLHPAAIALTAFFAMTIFCHVAGNAIGTRLRQIGDARDHQGCEARPMVRPEPHEFAPRTHLGSRQNLGWLIVVATSIGITCGAVGGGLWTFLAARGQAGAGNIAIGVVAFAILGGLASFSTIGLAQVLAGAIWQALAPPPTVQTTESAIDQPP